MVAKLLKTMRKNGVSHEFWQSPWDENRNNICFPFLQASLPAQSSHASLPTHLQDVTCPWDNLLYLNMEAQQIVPLAQDNGQHFCCTLFDVENRLVQTSSLWLVAGPV